MYVKDLVFGDQISRTRNGKTERIFQPPRHLCTGNTEISTSAAGVETTRTYPTAQMVWIEIL